MTVRTLILADDLTGAADAAAPFAGGRGRVRIFPWTGAERVAPAVAAGGEEDVVVIETATRDLDRRRAASRTSDVAAAVVTDDERWTVKKVDSLLRGPIDVEVAALRAGFGHPPVVAAPAFPTLGRTTVEGQQLLDGRPVDTRRGDPRHGTPNASVALACGLRAARVGPAGTPLPEGDEVVADATTDDHLDHVVASVSLRRPRPLLIGSRGLTEALARARSPALGGHGPDPARGGGAVSTLVVSLSPSPTARAQVTRLAESNDARPVLLDIGALASDPDRTVANASAWLRHAREASVVTVFSLVGSPPPRSRPDSVRSTVLAACTALLEGAADVRLIVANGGDAARCVVDVFAADHLDVVRALHDGAALARVPDGPALATKSGSFGDVNALRRVVDAAQAFVSSSHAPTREESR